MPEGGKITLGWELFRKGTPFLLRQRFPNKQFTLTLRFSRRQIRLPPVFRRHEGGRSSGGGRVREMSQEIGKKSRQTSRCTSSMEGKKIKGQRGDKRRQGDCSESKRPMSKRGNEQLERW